MTVALLRESVEVLTEYEPSVDDKIQRILYRLESGERLIHGSLKRGSNFCVLGLFADESGLGEWDGAMYRESSGTGVSILNLNIYKYYNLHNQSGMFNISDLPVELMNLVDVFQPYEDDTFSLMGINDSVGVHEDHNINVNQLLADIIRSGAIFNKGA